MIKKPLQATVKGDYKTFKTSPDGWYDVKKYLPVLFDLVKLRDIDSRETNGWWTGQSFDGRYLIEVVEWKNYYGRFNEELEGNI